MIVALWSPSIVLVFLGQFGLAFLLLACLRWAWKWVNLKRRFSKLPGPKPKFLLGNLPLETFYQNTYNGMGINLLTHTYALGFSVLYREEKVMAFWMTMLPYVMLFEQEGAEAILSSTTELDKTYEYNFLHDWLGTGLLTSTGRKWRSRRKMLTPSFHFRILDNFQEIFHEQSLLFVRKIKSLSEDSKPLDLTPLVTDLTLDIICETAMGRNLGAQGSQNNSYVNAIHIVSSIFMERVLRPTLWLQWIFRLTPTGISFYKNLRILHEFTDRVIRERKSELASSDAATDKADAKRRLVFMDILLEEQKKNALTDEDIREEVDTFMFEGHDTTSVGICWALFLIGNYPEVQKKIQQELDSIFGRNLDLPITSDNLKEMKYLECVLKESQRLYPSVPMIGRTLKGDLKVGKHVIPAGTTCMVFPPGLHRDPRVFPDPEIFDPDRFLPENCSGRHPYAYVPFSAGPRNCIGQRFALNEEKTVVAQCLRHFTIESLEQRDRIPVKTELVSRPALPLLVRFVGRK